MRWYFLRFGLFYGLEWLCAWLLPQHMIATAIATFATQRSPLLAYGGAALVGALNLLCFLAQWRHWHQSRLIQATSVLTLLYSSLIAIDVTFGSHLIAGAQNFGSPLIWWSMVACHITEYYVPSDLTLLVRRMHQRLLEEPL